MDIKKFFASVDHSTLMRVLYHSKADKNILWLLEKVIESFSANQPGIGLPLGNLTSQLLVNIYMNEFDQFVKHRLRIKHYLRYADDFVILSRDKEWLENQIKPIQSFLWEKLRLIVHPDKLTIKTLNSGVDFLGWVNFFDHRVLRTATKRRMLKRIKENPAKETINSYLGLIKHGKTGKVRELFP